MNSLNHPILVPIDFSPSTKTTVSHAAMLARKFNAGIVLMHAIETHFSGFNLAELALHSDSRENAIYQLVEERLKKQVYLLQDEGIKAEFRVDFGSVHRSIATAAADIQASYIVVGTHGQSGFEEFLIGSNTFRLCATAPSPVITVQDNKHLASNYKTIVMPVDTSFYTRQKVKATAELAKAFGAIIHIFGVSVEEDAESMHHVRVIIKQIAEYLEGHEIQFETNESFGRNITDATILYAKAINASLISIMTEQEPSVQSLIMGEYAQQMINQSPIPVISFRPREMSEHLSYSL